MSIIQDELKQFMLTMDASVKEESFIDKLNLKSKAIYDSVKDSVALKDSYGNSLLEIGNDSKSEKFNDYRFTNDTLNWCLWLSLYNDSWVFKRAIDKPAQDCIKCSIQIENNISAEEKSRIYKQQKLYRDDLIQLLTYGRLFGGSVAFCLFDNFTDEDYAKPYNAEKVSKAKVLKFYVVDRWYGVSPTYDITVDDITSEDFGKPKYYNITMPDGKTYKYHHDYVLRYENRIAPKIVKNGMLQGWGYAEGSHIFNELSRDEKLKSSIQSLINKSLIEVIKMSGMRGIFLGADKENEEQLRKRLEMVNWGRNFNSLTFLDKEDDYSMNNFSGLSGLADLLQQNMWMISSALEMQGVLFGDMKQGFSVDEQALERYDETINGICESYVRTVYQKLLKYIFTMQRIDVSPEFTFKSLLSKKQDKERIESIQTYVELCSKLLDSGVITTKLYAKSIQKYINKGEVDFGLTDEVIDKLDEDFESQMENINLDEEAETNENNIRLN